MYRLLKRGWPLLALAVLVAYPWIMSKPYYHGLGFNVLLYATMAVSWNIMGGYTGYKSLGHSAFYGLGAYLVAIAASRLGWNPLWSAPLLALAAGTLAFAVLLLHAGLADHCTGRLGLHPAVAFRAGTAGDPRRRRQGGDGRRQHHAL